MNFVIKILLSAFGVVITAYLLPGVQVADFYVAIILALVFGILNFTVKPILIVITIPLTVFTLGLFLLVINALIILIADSIVPGFSVDNFWWALLFSVILSIINSLLNDLRGSVN
jgi:putative membrane protein